ncbi:MAG: glycosyltransferase [Balneolaceae bacterium]|nr:MAG: glycosyltransferase [Balneolaceae bacterium]
MKKVLMIAPYFVPRRRVGSQRPFKFAIHLRDYGYEPVIVTIGTPGVSMTENEKELLEGIEIITVQAPFDQTVKKPSPEGEKKSLKGQYLLDWIDKHTPMDTWLFLFLTKYLSIKKRVTNVQPDLIWATGDPWSSLWLGEKLSRALEIPFIADFRDPWTLSKLPLRNRSSFSEGVDMEIEKRIIHSANKLIFTALLTEYLYSEFYNLPEEKTATIYNSYANTISDTEVDEWDADIDSESLNMIFFGQFRRLSPVKPIVKALKILQKKNSEASKRIKIHSFGKPDKPNMNMITDAGLLQNFTFHEPVEPEKKGQVLKHADILLLSTDEKREEVIPAKLWDYLSVHTPIFSIVPNPEVADIIMRTKAGVQVHPGEKMEIAALLESFSIEKENRSNSLFMPESILPDRGIYEANQTTKQLASIFDEVLENG